MFLYSFYLRKCPKNQPFPPTKKITRREILTALGMILLIFPSLWDALKCCNSNAKVMQYNDKMQFLTLDADLKQLYLENRKRYEFSDVTFF